MELLEQCQLWHEQDEHQKIADALEAIPAQARTPDQDMELARAYNNLADPGTPEGRELFRRATELMEQHQDTLGKTYSWHFPEYPDAVPSARWNSIRILWEKPTAGISAWATPATT